MPKPSNKTLYIIHGWAYSVEPWTKTIELLEQNDVKVKMLNVPGLTSPSKRVWTIQDYADWADKNIPDGSVALGHSNGGRILLNLCAKKPNKLKKLILLDSAGVYETSKKRSILRAIAKLGAPLKRIPIVSKVFHKLTGSMDYHRAPENMKKTLANMLESDKSLVLAKVTTPTAILWGENDTVTPPRQAHILKRKLVDSTLSMHEGWTHAPYISDPSGLAKAIMKELK
ncbi:alpha/beta hydrolase [Candidatus Saccharibacteria bacterium]|nr:alpha/beta hydrolase [Candidatus Saccharibacteria bacterium]